MRQAGLDQEAGKEPTPLVYAAEYRRMIAAIEAAAEQRGATKALREAAESVGLIDHMCRTFAGPSTQSLAVRTTSKYLHNIADQMEENEC